jgi:hypothetical protein
MMEVAILFMLAPFVMVVAIVGLVQAGRTARHYVDWRMRLAERQLERGSPSMRAAIEELRAEIASLKQRETEAIFSFDSSLERLESRMTRLEQRAVADGAAERGPLGAGTHPGDQPDRLTANTR